LTNEKRKTQKKLSEVARAKKDRRKTVKIGYSLYRMREKRK
jgi:hypothetical protein